LFIACQEGHFDTALLLLDRGATVNQARVRCMNVCACMRTFYLCSWPPVDRLHVNALC
jgi:hypothetical protein